VKTKGLSLRMPKVKQPKDLKIPSFKMPKLGMKAPDIGIKPLKPTKEPSLKVPSKRKSNLSWFPG
jgi:hypothetical protein